VKCIKPEVRALAI
jgi:hypothetical protein